MCRLLEPPVGRKSGPNFSKVKVIFLTARRAEVKPEFQSGLGDPFKELPEGRKSGQNFSQVKVTYF